MFRNARRYSWGRLANRRRIAWHAVAIALTIDLGLQLHVAAATNKRPIGVQGHVGCLENPKKRSRLIITKPGEYENYLIDSNWGVGNRVKITSDNVTIRNCEIINAKGNGIGVFASNVVIENCKIHHLLRGSFKNQDDAHGITGDGSNITIRNCEIYYVSGDAVQFSPDRRPWNNVLIEGCTFWTGPLPEDAAEYHKGERPGENGFDSKQRQRNPRSNVTLRDCLMYGWKQPGSIGRLAAINLKENVGAKIENCLFRDNQVALRLRGRTYRGEALVTIDRCAIFDSVVGLRLEDNIRNVKINRLGFGSGIGYGIGRKLHFVGRHKYPGFEIKNDFRATSFDELLKNGISE